MAEEGIGIAEERKVFFEDFFYETRRTSFVQGTVASEEEMYSEEERVFSEDKEAYSEEKRS